MAKYASYGRNDDQILDESDVGFFGFNNRLRPDQLAQGMLAYSQNGRIDINGEWRVRGGINNVSSPFVIESDSVVLRLPTSTEVGTTDQGVLPYRVSGASYFGTTLYVETTDIPDSEWTNNIASSKIQQNDEVQIEGLNFAVPPGSTFDLSNHWDPDANGTYTALGFTATGQSWVRDLGTYTYTFLTYSPTTEPQGVTSSYFVFYKQQGNTPVFQHNSGSPVKNELFPWQEIYGNDIFSGKEFTGTFSNLKYNRGTIPAPSLDLIDFPNTLPGQSISVASVGIVTGKKRFWYTFQRQNIDSPLAFDVALTLPFTLDGTPIVYGSDYTSASIGKAMELSSGISATSIVCSTTWSNPSLSGGSYVIMATQGSVSYYNVGTGETGSIGLPANESIPDKSSMLQAFNKVYIFRDAQAALEWDGSFTNPFFAVESGEYTQPTEIALEPGSFLINNNVGSVAGNWNVKEGQVIEVLSPGTIDSGLGIGERYTVFKVTEEGDEVSITGLASSGPEASGEYEGLYKITITAVNHGLNNGDPIVISGLSEQGSDNDDINGSRFVIDSSTDTFVIYVSSANSNPSYTLSGTPVVKRTYGFEFYIQPDTLGSHVDDGVTLTSDPILTKRVPGPGSLGYTHMPAPEFAVYHQRRLAMPYRYTVDADSTGQYTYRNVSDEIIFSDILDGDTYDAIYGQLRFNAGTSDYLVGLHSFSDDKLVVFNRNSIHIVLTAGDVSQFGAQLITNEVGCVARKSIVQVGSNLMFLSDNGIYGVNFQDLYNLRGNEVPLSESINPIIKTINKDSWSKSCAVYFDNRYYIAVPTGTADENNTILIFNFLNKNWESVDTVDNPAWNIRDLIVAGEGQSRGVFAVSTTGSLHKLDTDEVVDKVGFVIPSAGSEAEIIDVQIDAEMVSRQMTMKIIDRKKWHEFEVHAESSESSESDFDIQFLFENPDSETDIRSASSLNQTVKNVGGQNLWFSEKIPSGEDVSLRGRIGSRRSYGLQFRLNNFEGSPRIRALKASGSISYRSITRGI